MRINSSEIIKDYDGNELNYPTKKGKEFLEPPLTVKDAIVLAMTQAYPQEVKTAEQITKINGLTHKFYVSPEIDLTEDDRIFIKERVLMSVQHGLWKPIVYDYIEKLLTPQEDKGAAQESN